jgi:hypothetical protein
VLGGGVIVGGEHPLHVFHSEPVGVAEHGATAVGWGQLLPS